MTEFKWEAERERIIKSVCVIYISELQTIDKHVGERRFYVQMYYKTVQMVMKKGREFMYVRMITIKVKVM